MNATTLTMPRIALSIFTSLGLLGLLSMPSLTGIPCLAQEKPDHASISSVIGEDGTGTIIVEAHGRLPSPPDFYTASVAAAVQVGSEYIEQVVQLTAKVIQGKAKTLSFGLTGEGQVTEVQDAALKSWSVRKVGSERFRLTPQRGHERAQLCDQDSLARTAVPRCDRADASHPWRVDWIQFDGEYQ